MGRAAEGRDVFKHPGQSAESKWQGRAPGGSKAAANLSPTVISPISSLHGVTWQAIRPNPIDAGGNVFWNGRVNANQIYIGTTGGGVWKSNDAGADWTPLTDHLL